jgi:hypothetical protein
MLAALLFLLVFYTISGGGCHAQTPYFVGVWCDSNMPEIPLIRRNSSSVRGQIAGKETQAPNQTAYR